MADEEIHAAIKAIEEKVLVHRQSIRRLEEACATLKDLVSETATAESQKGPLTDLTQKAAVRAILKDSSKGKLPEQIFEALEKGGKHIEKRYVSILLYRMNKAGEVRRRNKKYYLISTEEGAVN